MNTGYRELCLNLDPLASLQLGALRRETSAKEHGTGGQESREAIGWVLSLVPVP
jgi:hypothetical protein